MANIDPARAPVSALTDDVNQHAQPRLDPPEGLAQPIFTGQSVSVVHGMSGSHDPSGSAPSFVDGGRRLQDTQPSAEVVPPPVDGAILAPATNLEAFKVQLLPHDDDDENFSKVDLQKWFEDFESACWRGHGAGTIHQFWWLEQLFLQMTPHARHHVNNIIAALSRKKPHLSRFEQYIEVRDAPLLEQPDRYSAIVYFDQMMTLRAGEKRALALQRHIERLKTHYEVARVRDGKAAPPKVMPELTEYFVTTLPGT